MSTAPGTITSYDWSYGITTMLPQTTTSPVLDQPPFNCSLIPAGPYPPGQQSLTMTVKLKIRDSNGNTSAEVVDNGVRLLPKGVCGYP
jgi:hypothetical protein